MFSHMIKKLTRLTGVEIAKCQIFERSPHGNGWSIETRKSIVVIVAHLRQQVCLSFSRDVMLCEEHK